MIVFLSDEWMERAETESRLWSFLSIPPLDSNQRRDSLSMQVKNSRCAFGTTETKSESVMNEWLTLFIFPRDLPSTIPV